MRIKYSKFSFLKKTKKNNSKRPDQKNNDG